MHAGESLSRHESGLDSYAPVYNVCRCSQSRARVLTGSSFSPWEGQAPALSAFFSARVLLESRHLHPVAGVYV